MIAGYDASDPTCADMPVPDYLAGLDGSIAGMRFGVEREHGLASVDPAIATLFEEAVDVLKSLGADVEDVVIPRYDIYRTASTAISTLPCLVNLSELPARFMRHCVSRPPSP